MQEECERDMIDSESQETGGSRERPITEAHWRTAEKLDTLAGGFPPGVNGEHVRLVAELFSEEDAALFALMPDEYLAAEELAKIAGVDEEATAALLTSMSKRGLIYRRYRQDLPVYRPVPFVVGIYEFQVGRLTESLLKRVREYFALGEFGKTFYAGQVPYLRSVPVNRQLVVNDEVLPIDDAVAIVRSKQRISVADCLCRKSRAMWGDVCSHSLETCMAFDAWADYYVENGMGRYIGQDEALEILRRDEEEGLIIEVSNSQDVEVMCACCSCHCASLIGLRHHPGPALRVFSNYKAEREEAICTNCLRCVPRCPSGARTELTRALVFDQERCIGCGLCVSVCASGASMLRRKDEAECYEPPQDLFAAYAEVQEGRGR